MVSGLPQVPSVIGVVEDDAGNRVAVSMDREQIEEIPLVHMSESMERQLIDQYANYVEPGQRIDPPQSTYSSTGVPDDASRRSSLTAEEQAQVDNAFPYELRKRIQESLPTGAKADEILSNGKTLREMVVNTILHDTVVEDEWD